MRKTSAQSGIGHVLVLGVLVLAFAAIGFIGYKLYAHPANRSSSGNTTNTTTAELSAPEITSSSDLDKATSTLDQVDPSSSNQSDEATLDKQLEAF